LSHNVAAASAKADRSFVRKKAELQPPASSGWEVVIQFTRREFLDAAASTAMLPATTITARAEKYPSRPVHWIVSFPAGGANDIVARVIAQYLSDYFGEQFVIENRAGAGGNVGMESALKSAPDGYTIAFVGPNNAISATLYPKLPFDFIRDSEPIAGVIQLTNVMEVHPSLPAKTLAEFLAYAKANPGKINFASPGVGTSPHLSGELLKVMTGIDIVNVSYRGAAPALTDVLAGRVPVMFDNLPSSIAHLRNGELRPLGVTAAKRIRVLPDVPAIAETVPGYEASVWYGLAAPKGTPRDIIEKLNQAVTSALTDQKVQSRLAELGGEPMPMAPAAFGKLVSDETEKWGRVIRAANIKAE
jgi:tripartite-type tricarboxylate transporter receptor subunit TctC